MRRLLPLLALGVALATADAAGAQQPRTISAGMTTDEVRATFGAPTVVRQADGWTYFFYTNRCLPRCGTDDTVFFQDGRVVAAVLHSPARRFTGPRAADALGEAAPPRETGVRSLSVDPAPAMMPEHGAAVTGIRIRSGLSADEPAANLGVIRGRRAGFLVADTAEAAADTLAPPAGPPAGPDQERQQRERQLQPNTVRPAPAQGAPPAEPRPATPPREERIEANTIRRAPRP